MTAAGLGGRLGRRMRVAAIALAAVVGACGAPQPSVAPATPSPAVSTPAGAPPSAASPAAATSSPDGPPSLPPGVTVDPGLLEVFPATVDGVALEPDPATAAQIASDPLLSDSVLSLAVTVAAAPGSGGSAGAEDFAVATVIRLRPNVFDEAFYQEWRDTYDDAACEVADGVASDTQTQIGDRVVYEATCTGGAETYHTYLVDQGFLISVTGTGDRRLGERIMAGLTG